MDKYFSSLKLNLYYKYDIRFQIFILNFYYNNFVIILNNWRKTVLINIISNKSNNINM